MKRDWNKALEMVLREGVMFHGYDAKLMQLFGPQQPAQPQQKPQKAKESNGKPKDLMSMLGFGGESRNAAGS